MIQTPNIRPAKKVYEEMLSLTKHNLVHRNYSALISMQDYLVASSLFSKDALLAYSNYNMGNGVSPEDKLQYFSDIRGGSQGDYSEEMPQKIDNVIDCLNKFPNSKRASINIPNSSLAHHSSDADAKCLREIYFYIDNNRLCATVFMRAQAAIIFPKNIHFIGTLMDHIGSHLDSPIEPDYLYYLTVNLVHDRA
jgi:hypothetical protein